MTLATTCGTPSETAGEICLFGMSDDEGEEASSEGADEEADMVAAPERDGVDEGAFAAACGNTLDPEQLGLAALCGPSMGDQRCTVLRPCSPSMRPRDPPKLLSPLIAQLNPFMPPSRMLDIHLPPAESAHMYTGLQPPMHAQTPTPEDNMDADQLLVEMGDLVCLLKKKQELAITAQDIRPEELLSRLAHFREIANSDEMRR